MRPGAWDSLVAAFGFDRDWVFQETSLLLQLQCGKRLLSMLPKSSKTVMRESLKPLPKGWEATAVQGKNLRCRACERGHRTAHLLWDAPGPVLEQRRLVEEPLRTSVLCFVELSPPATVGWSRDGLEILARGRGPDC